jgi:AraC-like DNA-binding protein
MEDTDRTIDVVAQQTGFGDRNRMRRAFLRAYGQPPQVIRRQSRGCVPIKEIALAEALTGAGTPGEQRSAAARRACARRRRR